MKFCSALFFTVLFFACITRLHAPDGIEEASISANEKKPESSESPKPVTQTEDPNLSSSPDDSSTPSQEISSISSATLEAEEVITPTVAPATPSYDAESSSPVINSASSIKPHATASDYVLASVILIPPSNPGQIQSSQGSQDAKVNKAGVSMESVVPTKEPEILSSVLDSTPPNPISNEPTPTPPTTTTGKEDEDSITAALKQAEEESKPKEEEMPSFDEFKRRVLQEEEEKNKQLNVESASGTVQKPKKVKERKQSNFASVDCGAKMLDHNTEASNADSVLVENKDLYMLNPCSAQVWFVVELCDLAQVKSIQIANFELFSSTPESFRVYVSTRYPTREWTMLGTFQAREEREIQTFPLDEPIYAKYFKVEMLSHFGSEHYCPLSLLRVYGSSMMEELEDHETGGQEDSDNADSDSDVPVLPPEPGAKVEDGSKKPNLLERAADTVFNLVKKFTGNGHNKEIGGASQEEVGNQLDAWKSSNGVVTNEVESQDENKGKLVTLVGHEELKENPEDLSSSGDVRNSSQGKSAPVNVSDKGSSWNEEMDDQKESKTTSIAPSSCQLFSQVIGQYSLGCFLGRLLFSKSKNFTSSLDVAKRQKIRISNKTSPASDAKETNESVEKKEGSDQAEIISKREEPIQEKSSATESFGERNYHSQVKPQQFSVLTPKPSSSNVELKSENEVSSKLEFVETTSTSSRIVQPSHSIDSLENSEMSDDRTPALADTSVVTSVPLNSTQSAYPSQSLQSSEVLESKESSVETVKGSIDNQQDAPDEQLLQTSLPSNQSTVLDGQHLASMDKDSSRQPEAALNPPDVTSESEGQGEKNSSNADEKEGKEEQKSKPTPSESAAPNLIHMMPQSSPDIDVLETKLTDKDGREGTAQLPEEVHVNLGKDQLPSVNGPSKSEVVIDSPSVKVQPADSVNKETVSSEVLNQERASDSTGSSSTAVESQSIDPTVQPTSPPTVDTPDLSDSIFPLPAPPITGEASLSSLEVATASSESNLDAAMLSKAQQAATSSAGMASVSGSGLHKESIFVRLSNKIKALEQNLNMSTLYMEQLNQRYRKSLDELQKNSDKKVALLTNATKKAEAVINSQKEQITKLQSKLDNLTNMVADMKARMDPLNKEVMERHIIGLCIEIMLILVLFMVFARRRRNIQELPDSPRRSAPLLNGHGPPRLAIEGGRRYRDDLLNTTVSLSGREQLLFSFGKTPVPETVGASVATDSLDNKLLKVETLNPNESKRKRNRKRKASSTPYLPPDSPGVHSSNTPEPTPDTQSSADTPSPASLVSRTAGLLFFGARGFFGGFQNPWKQKNPSAVQSDTNIAGRSESTQVNKASFRANNQGITRTKSLDFVPEEAALKTRVPPPPPPPLPTEFGVMFKRPPDCYHSKKGNVKNVTSGAIKYGKYGVLNTQLA